MKILEKEAEEQLINRLRARDETAMTYFYENYKRTLYFTIWRLVRHKQLAEDILQETMLKFWLAFPSYDTKKGRLFTWALNIARNLAIDRLRELRRSAQHTQSLTEDITVELAAATTFKPEHIGVRGWLDLLSPSDRQLLDVLYLKGFTHSEAAEELQIPLGTVKSRVGRIIRKLAAAVN